MNSECSDHQKQIPAFLMGDLSGHEKQKLESHLASCANCRSERERYDAALQQLASVGEETVPHHFFIYPEQQAANPWRLFRQMRLGWQTVLACAAILMFVVAVGAISRLQIQSSPGGWSISFGRNDADLAALKKDFLETTEKKNREARAAWMQEAQSEISRFYDSLNRQQQTQLAKTLARMDSRITGRITNSEGQVREDTQKLVSSLYRVIAQERARDLEAINLRFDSADANNAIKTRQTNEILDTLLQVAEVRLR
jgi:hypothetical protein